MRITTFKIRRINDNRYEVSNGPIVVEFNAFGDVLYANDKRDKVIAAARKIFIEDSASK